MTHVARMRRETKTKGNEKMSRSTNYWNVTDGLGFETEFFDFYEAVSYYAGLTRGRIEYYENGKSETLFEKGEIYW